MDKNLIKRMLYFMIGIVIFILMFYLFFYVVIFLILFGLIHYVYSKFFKKKKKVAPSKNKKVGPVIIDMEED